jgi:hypothetical protein
MSAPNAVAHHPAEHGTSCRYRAARSVRRFMEPPTANAIRATLVDRFRGGNAASLVRGRPAGSTLTGRRLMAALRLGCAWNIAFLKRAIGEKNAKSSWRGAARDWLQLRRARAMWPSCCTPRSHKDQASPLDVLDGCVPGKEGYQSGPALAPGRRLNPTIPAHHAVRMVRMTGGQVVGIINPISL